MLKQAERVAVPPLAVKWSDLGGFDAFFDEFPRDEEGNVTFNGGILLDAAGNLIEISLQDALLIKNDVVIISLLEPLPEYRLREQSSSA